jgi:hypothetical protein
MQNRKILFDTFLLMLQCTTDRDSIIWNPYDDSRISESELFRGNFN